MSRQPKHRIFVDMHFRRAGHDLYGSDVVGSWSNMKLRDTAQSLTQEAGSTVTVDDLNKICTVIVVSLPLPRPQHSGATG